MTDVQLNGTSVVSQGVANVPIANGNNPGVIMTNAAAGIDINATTGKLRIAKASASETRLGTTDYKPITPSIQHQAAFYGLAKAAGDTSQSAIVYNGIYTDAAIDKILSMLGIDTLIGPHEKTGLASEAKAIGDPFVYLGKLYKATDAIAQGAAIVPGTNCAETNLIELIRGM